MAINHAKYENTVLYICNQLNGEISGKKKLAKLLYYIDFDMYEYKESMHTITNDIYKKLPMGPVPNAYMDVIGEMCKNGFIERKQRETGLDHPTEIFIAKREADLAVFNEDELFVLNRVILKYGHLNGRELETLSHAEAPYISVELSEVIPFEYAFYRGTFDNEILTA